MSWTDEDIDRLFREAGDTQSFEYKQEYWNEVEAMLPQQKKRDFLWFITAFGSMGVLLLGFFYSTTQFEQSQMSEQQGEEAELLAVKMNLSKNNHEPVAKTGKKGELSAVFSDENLGRSLKGTWNGFDFSGLSIGIGNWDLSNYNWQMYGPLCNQIYSMPMYGDAMGTTYVQSGSESNDAMVLGTKPLVSELDNSLATIGAKGPDKFPARVSLYLQANAGLSQSLISPSNELFVRYGGGIGINIHTNKWTTTIGINGSISNHNDIALSRVAKYYSYGSQMVTHNINYKSLYSLEGVLAVTRNFGRHGVTVGIRPSYLTTTKVDYSRVDEQQGEVSQRKELVGFTDGINRFGLKPTLGYSFMLNEKWNTGLNLGVQMMETFKPEYITKDNNRFPIDGQIYIRRNIQLRK